MVLLILTLSELIQTDSLRFLLINLVPCNLRIPINLSLGVLVNRLGENPCNCQF